MAASRCQPSAGRFAAAALSGKGDGSRVIPARCQMPRQSNCTAPPSGTTASGSHNRQSASAYMQVLAPVELTRRHANRFTLVEGDPPATATYAPSPPSTGTRLACPRVPAVGRWRGDRRVPGPARRSAHQPPVRLPALAALAIGTVASLAANIAIANVGPSAGSSPAGQPWPC